MMTLRLFWRRLTIFSFSILCFTHVFFFADGLWAEANPMAEDRPTASHRAIDDRGLPDPVVKIDETGTIRGRITFRNGLDPNFWVDINAYRSDTLDFAGRGSSFGVGDYQIDLRPGRYYLVVEAPEVADEIYPDLPCPTRPEGPCAELTSGTEIAVVAGQTVDGIDFELDFPGSVSGTVVDGTTGEPLERVKIAARSVQGYIRGFAMTDDTGFYRIEGLEPTEYFITTLQAELYAGYDGQLYEGIACLDDTCDVTLGDPVAVELSVNTPGIDFSLNKMASLSGRITDRLSGEPLDSSRVRFRDQEGLLRHVATTGPDGTYVLEGLPAGTWYLATEKAGYVPHLWGDLPCPEIDGCEPLDGTAIQVEANAEMTGFDLQPYPSAQISGRLLDAQTGEPLSSGLLRLWTADGQAVASGSLADDGTFTIPGLGTAVYERAFHLVAEGPPAYLDEAWGGVWCPTSQGGLCEPTTGTPIVLSPTEERTGVDIELDLGAGLTGTVLESETGEPRVTGVVELWTPDGERVASAGIASDGEYLLEGVVPGSYRVATQTARHVDEAYPDLRCPFYPESCDPTEAQLVEAQLGEVSTLDFELELGGEIQGEVTDGQFGFPVTSGLVYARDAAGRVVGRSYTYPQPYRLGGLPVGEATFVTAEDPHRGDQLYPALPCDEGLCDMTAGQALYPNAEELIDNIDFVLQIEDVCAEGLCLGVNGRFHVEVIWTDPSGQSGLAQGTALGTDSAHFWFFDPGNVELMVKVLDACAINDYFWIFAAGLTDVEVEIKIRDRFSSQTRTYRNPPGSSFQTITDTSALNGCGSASGLDQPTSMRTTSMATTPVASSTAVDPCAAEPDVLCLADGRFRIRAHWRSSDSQGDGLGASLSDASGTFWFFDENNVELLVKVLDGCAINDRYWIFAAGLTDLEVTLEIDDTVGLETRSYSRPLGEPFEPVIDTNALQTCDSARGALSFGSNWGGRP